MVNRVNRWKEHKEGQKKLGEGRGIYNSYSVHKGEEHIEKPRVHKGEGNIKCHI